MFPRLPKPPSVSAEGMLHAQLPAVPTASLTASDRPPGGKTCRVLGQDRDADTMLVWHLGILSRGTTQVFTLSLELPFHPTHFGVSLAFLIPCFPQHPRLVFVPFLKWEAALRVAPPGGWWQRAGTACPAQDRAQGARGEHFHHLCGAQPPGADLPDGSGLPSLGQGAPSPLRLLQESARKPAPSHLSSPPPCQGTAPAPCCPLPLHLACGGGRNFAAGRGWVARGGLRTPRRLPPLRSRSRLGSGTHLAARGTAAGCSRRRARTPSRSHSGGAPGGSRCGGGGGCAPSTRSPRSPPPARPSRARCWRRGPRGGRNRHRHRHLTERPRPGGAGPRGGQGARPAPAPAPASGGPASPPGPAAATRWTGPARPRRRDCGC